MLKKSDFFLNNNNNFTKQINHVVVKCRVLRDELKRGDIEEDDVSLVDTSG